MSWHGGMAWSTQKSSRGVLRKQHFRLGLVVFCIRANIPARLSHNKVFTPAEARVPKNLVGYRKPWGLLPKTQPRMMSDSATTGTGQQESLAGVFAPARGSILGKQRQRSRVSLFVPLFSGTVGETCL